MARRRCVCPRVCSARVSSCPACECGEGREQVSTRCENGSKRHLCSLPDNRGHVCRASVAASDDVMLWDLLGRRSQRGGVGESGSPAVHSPQAASAAVPSLYRTSFRRCVSILHLPTPNRMLVSASLTLRQQLLLSSAQRQPGASSSSAPPSCRRPTSSSCCWRPPLVFLC